MARWLAIAAVQAAPLPAENALERLANNLHEVAGNFQHAELIIYPELYLCGLPGLARDRDEGMRKIAEPIDGPRVARVKELATEVKRWLVPGSVYELSDDGIVYNTTMLISPAGEVVATYRKVFPWRPYELCHPGNRFVVADIPNRGRIGLAICYDTWFPETARHLTWMGAEVIITPTLTPTSDRPQELVLSRANAIANQVFVVSVNGASPYATGRSLIVDPEGTVRHQAGEGPTVVTDVLDLEAVQRVRTTGTGGLNRMWDQFGDQDEPIELPLYGGQIGPTNWRPKDESRTADLDTDVEQ